MNMVATSSGLLQEDQRLCVTAACDRIAPNWPLDQLIAVNPFWELRQQPMEQASARLATLAGIDMTMPGEYYLQCWQDGVIGKRHLQQAAAEQQLALSLDELLAKLQRPHRINRVRLFCDLLDGQQQTIAASWQPEIVHQISQFCAARFNSPEMLDYRRGDLYQSWLRMVRHDAGIGIVMGARGLARRFRALPDQDEALLTLALEQLQVPDEQLTDYCHALLLSVNGWASWLAYRRWQQRLQDSNATADDEMRQLLAIRLAWELVLYQHYGDQHWQRVWQQSLQQWSMLQAANHAAQAPLWLWQRALELAYQERMHNLLLHQRRWQLPAPKLQAVFCIDVRSEPYRRALEAQDDAIQTFGFAGFFGLPLAYHAAGSDYQRPQLPGLLAPSITVTEARDDDATRHAQQQRQRSNDLRASWLRLQKTAPASFHLIESFGLLNLYPMLRSSLSPAANRHSVNQHHRDTSGYLLSDHFGRLSVQAQAELAAQVLRNMQLTKGFAPLVLLVGHGSCSSNNPHAAALDCGACGGQTGELNVRVLASMLNNEDVRWLLRDQGLDIPDHCRFVAAMHNTTTDELSCLQVADSGLDNAQQQQLQNWLDTASEQARRARAEQLPGVDPASPRLLQQLQQRSRDWSQTRPEWGLANNAAFIAAPRMHTRGMDLHGRCFLHDYQWRHDTDFQTLELILTAPVIVANWINLQYYASVTDNRHYGSGSKLLHNVVGGHLGVFEGNGGDLRIGLPMQSLHDGKHWMHQPLRLSVYVQAPEQAISNIVARHEPLRDLLDNDWLYLFRLSEDNRALYRYTSQQWQEQIP